MVAILGYTKEQIFAAVRQMYDAVATLPDARFHFPVGDAAARVVRYPPERLEALPLAVRESFAGVGYPFTGEAIAAGDRVLDIGAGAGSDSLIASQLVGASGHVTALDLTPAMTRKLRRAAREQGVHNLSVVEGSAEGLPFADESLDAITSNGALNLVPDKRRAIAEMFRVLRPGGRLQLADVVIDRPVSVDCHDDPRLWVECVVGATVEEDLLAYFRDAGFEDVALLRTLDYFAHSPSAQTREIAASFGARSVELSMRRGARRPHPALQWLRRLDPRRLSRSLWRRGFVGVAAVALAVVACYGTLLAVGLLAALGFGLALNETVWSGAIALFSLLAALAAAAGYRRHGAFAPGVLALAGAATVHFALFVAYHPLVELLGFVLLAAAVGWDLRARRRVESRVLGLEDVQPARGSSGPR